MQTQAPWNNDSNPPSGQVVIGGTQPQVLAGQPTNQQVIYVQAPAFKPSPNYRNISYIVLSVGILLYLSTIFLNVVAGGDEFYTLGNSMCCGSIGIACMLDAMYYNDKSNWQRQTGADSGGSTVGMIVDILFGVLCFGMVVLMLIGGF
ncbi:MAG: hypothetical protein VYB17_02100 [Candidatus Thermoplasmatota archaeon]|nr:hypothetical protein [Candidatus Thermoplasmatota archaeon]